MMFAGLWRRVGAFVVVGATGLPLPSVAADRLEWSPSHRRPDCETVVAGQVTVYIEVPRPGASVNILGNCRQNPPVYDAKIDPDGQGVTLTYVREPRSSGQKGPRICHYRRSDLLTTDGVVSTARSTCRS